MCEPKPKHWELVLVGRVVCGTSSHTGIGDQGPGLIADPSMDVGEQANICKYMLSIYNIYQKIIAFVTLLASKRELCDGGPNSKDAH